MIAGKWKSQKLQAPSGQSTRPTTDRVKESMFNLLPHALDGLVVDLFAGTGALGIEALSRGATSAIFVERDPAAARTLRTNVAKVSAQAQSQVWQVDWRQGLTRLLDEELSWVFVDPPYRYALWTPVIQMLESSQVIGGIVCEAPKEAELPSSIGNFHVAKHKVYGDIAVIVYRQDR